MGAAGGQPVIIALIQSSERVYVDGHLSKSQPPGQDALGSDTVRTSVSDTLDGHCTAAIASDSAMDVPVSTCLVFGDVV